MSSVIDQMIDVIVKKVKKLNLVKFDVNNSHRNLLIINSNSNRC